jgi:putative DNA primase/helicase
MNYLSPAAVQKGNDYLIGDLDGNSGDSLVITVKAPKAGMWKDFATGQGGKKLSSYWKAVRKIAPSDHQSFFAQVTSFAGQTFGYEPAGGPIDWPKHLADWTCADAAKLVKLRGYSREFVDWLHDQAHGVGNRYSRIVFPVLDPGGAMVGLHRYIDEEGKLKFSKGCKVHPLVIDTGGPITEVHVHESRWDCYALASASGWYREPGMRFISTLGAGNGRLIKGLVPPGAKLYLWPQNDHPGKNSDRPNEAWRKVVAANAGCEAMLAELPPQHKDINDWIRSEVAIELDLGLAKEFAQPYQSATKVIVEAAPASPSKRFPSDEERPCYRIYDAAFEEDGASWPAGVYLHDLEEKTNRSTREVTIRRIDHWILSVVRVIAITRTDVGKEHGYLLEFISHGETALRREVMPQSLLVSRSDEFMMLLRSWGVSALHENGADIRHYLDSEHKRFSAEKPKDFWESVKVVGWHLPSTFVLPDRIIGDQDSGIWFQGSGEAAQYASAGTLEEWKNQVAVHAHSNPYLVFAISCGFSGPLLNLLNVTGVGFHFLGDSTSGKTTALLVSTSVWGPPKFMLSWRQTANRLEAQAASRSDTLLTIDESHLIDPRSLDAALYLISSGQAKGRCKRDASAAYTARWRIPVLSSGERALETHLSAGNLDPKAGQGVRICDIPIEGKHGAFEQLPSDLDPAAFADMLRQNAAKTYGTAGPAFVQRLIQEMPNLDLNGLLTQIVNGLDTEALSAQGQRVWRSFALVGLAGQLATRFDVVPWKLDSAIGAVCDLFKIWLQAQPESSKPKEHAQALQRVLDFIERHGDSRFTNIDVRFRTTYENGVPVDVPTDEQPIARDRAGWWEDIEDRRIYLFTIGGLHEAIGDLDFRRALRALDEAGAFVEKGTDGEKAKRRRTPNGGNPKLYWIDPEKLQQP